MTKKNIPGSVLGSTTLNSERVVQVNGNLRGSYLAATDPRNQNVTATTIYDCASLTKAVVTTTLVQLLLREKEISLTDSVAMFLPDAVWSQEITIADLLSYTVDFNLRLSLLKDNLPAEITNEILNVQKVEANLAQPLFVNTTSMVLGWILESVTQQPLQVLAAEQIFKPLGMDSTWLDVAGDTRAEQLRQKYERQIAPSEIDSWRGTEVCGQVHDESAWVFARQGRAVGSAGLFSCVPDLLSFAEWMLQTQQLQQNTLGWERNADWMPAKTTRGKNVFFGKSGFTGCGIIISPEKNKAAVLLTNAVYPHRPNDRTVLNTFRREKLATALE